MTEFHEDAGVSAAAPSSVTAGRLLRAAREAQGLDMDALAALLKVARRKLEALEADRYDELQGATFVRALAQAACRALKHDPVPVLALLPHAEGALMHLSGGLNAPFRERGLHREAGDSWLARRGFLVLIGLLVLMAAALFWMPGDWQEWRSWSHAAHEETVAGATANGANTEGVPLGATQVMGASSPEMPVAVVSVAAVSAAASVDILRPAVPQPVASGGALVAPSAPASSAIAAVADGGRQAELLMVRARENTWVEVVDASGKTLLGRMVIPGESVRLDGAVPLRVKIGNAKGTELTLRGQPVDLLASTRDNIARLELK